MTGGPPKSIGHYEVTRELGRGGMGVVYLGRDTRLDRDVAIKALPAELASDPVCLDRFEREAKTLAGLHHPNIAGIYGIVEQDGAKYLVLEYIEGETLADRIDRGPIRVDEALELAAEIAAGVEAAHEAGVIHRDLKPGNIIVTPGGKARVLDFGLARFDEGGSSSSGRHDSPTITVPQPQHSPTIAGTIL
ncbi:MAG: serine/threonine protein kinase, partial [Phycisphaerales bacterium]|nr:serine/threonine protein kinase [Phycisphaerales bacterium]